MWKISIIRQILWRGYYDIRLRAAFTGIIALLWWGVLYPELCFTEGTYQQVMTADGEEKAVNEADYRELLEAAGDEVVIKSRLMEWLEQQKWFRH